MDLLLLLASSLLCSWRPVAADQHFRIQGVSLTIQPGSEVRRGTNVTLRCQAKVMVSHPELPLRRDYVMYKDEQVVYRKATSSPEDFVYPLPNARVSNTGKYKCSIQIQDQQMTSETQKLTVTGLSLPLIRLNETTVTEGEDVTATCEAPGETGSFYFHFFDGSGELHEERVSSNRVEAKLRLKTVGRHEVHCNYTVVLMPKSVDSGNSITYNVTVKKLSIAPVLDISPLDNIYEGDNLTIRCSSETDESFKRVGLILSQGTKLLSSRNSSSPIEHHMRAEATPPTLTFECTLIVENVVKVATQNVSVMDLFSVPTLAMSPSEVFQGEPMTLTCRSDRVAPERLSRLDLVYSLDPAEHFVTAAQPGVFSRTAMKSDFSYTCTAEAEGIKKRSKALTVRPKVHVSVPVIWVKDKVILGKSFDIYCESESGSLPIAYTLWKGTNRISTFTVDLIRQRASFHVAINHTKDISMYECEASNGGKKIQRSDTLNITAIEPVDQPKLLVLPDLADISEGSDLHLICSVEGTPPITFWWYREGQKEPLGSSTSDQKHANYHFTVSSKEQSGRYYCKMENRASNVVESDRVNIEVRMALWKKALIGGFLLLLASIIILVGCVLYFKSKRGPVVGAVESVWSHRKPESEIDDEFSTVSNEPEVEYTEVVHPRSAGPSRATPPRKGTDTVYSELQNSAHGAADHHDYGSVKYTEVNGEQPEISQNRSEGNNYSDLPVLVD